MENAQRIKKATDNIDELLKETFSCLGKEYRNGKTVNKDTEFFFYLILQKLTDNLFTANLLLKKVNDLNQIYGGLCLILRTCLTDIITFYHLHSFIKGGETKDEEQIDFQNRVRDMWGEHLSFIIEYNQKMSSWGYINKDNKEKERVLINKLFEDYFETPLDVSWKHRLKKRDKFSVGTIMNEGLAKNKLVVKAYELYHIYSKLEHNGEVTYDTHNWYYNNPHSAINYLFESFSVISTTVIIVSENLFAELDGKKEIFQALQTKFKTETFVYEEKK
jgi:hypothetical protein